MTELWWVMNIRNIHEMRFDVIFLDINDTSILHGNSIRRTGMP